VYLKSASIPGKTEDCHRPVVKFHITGGKGLPTGEEFLPRKEERPREETRNERLVRQAASVGGGRKGGSTLSINPQLFWWRGRQSQAKKKERRENRVSCGS